MSATDYSGPERRRGGPDRRAARRRSRGSSIVDDHALFRMGIANILGREPDFEIVAEADDRAVARSIAALETSPDIILMDLSLPAPGGIETTQRIKRELPSDRDHRPRPDRGRGRAVRRDQGRRRGVHPQGRRPGRPGHDHPPRRRRRVPHQRQGLLQAGRRLARPQGVPRAGGLRPGGRPDLRAAVAARGRDPRQHRPGHDQQAGRLRAVDQRADRQEPHELDPAQAVRQRPDPGRRLRDAPGLDPDAGGLIATHHASDPTRR